LSITPIAFNFQTNTEIHLHIDSWMNSGFLKRVIPNFFKYGKEHNFDHYLRDHEDLNMFHGNEPIEHASAYFEYAPKELKKVSIKAQRMLSELDQHSFKGYLEYELVQEFRGFHEYDSSSDWVSMYDIPDFAREKALLDEECVYYELHFTIPVEFLKKHKQVIQKLKLKGVSLNKNNYKNELVKHAVMTGLYDSLDVAKKTFLFLKKLNINLALKIEQKKYLLSKHISNQSVNIEIIRFS
ncbi:MAG: hypothetical protein AAGF07_00610, partial [Patescibacteria group bacterium]